MIKDWKKPLKLLKKKGSLFKLKVFSYTHEVDTCIHNIAFCRRVNDVVSFLFKKMLLFNWYLVSFYCCFQCCVIIKIYIGLNSGLKLFYLAADSVAEATSAVVLADSFVKPTGADKHQEERKKTGSYLICIAIQ